MESTERKGARERSDAEIHDHVMYTMAAALIPIPLIDIGAVAGLQLHLVQRLASIHGVAYDAERGKAILSSLAGAMLPKLGASFFKWIPGVGWIVGGATQVVLSGAATHALGNVFRHHFEGNGSFGDFDPIGMADVYRDYFDRGKRVARAARGSHDSAERRRVDHLSKTLERLDNLRSSGVLSEAEFERLKTLAVYQN